MAPPTGHGAFEEIIAKGRTAMVALNDFTPLQGGVPIITVVKSLAMRIVLGIGTVVIVGDEAATLARPPMVGQPH
jgi:hypothetical protein